LSENRDQIEQIKSSIDIVKYIERNIALTKKGNVYRGATSDNSVSGASLVVDPRQQIYNNFAEDDGGDIFNWIAFDEGLDIETDFSQILSIAAEYAGIQLESANPIYTEEKHTLLPILSDAADFYHSCLNEDGIRYIKNTWGISEKMINELKIGWAPGNNDLLLYLRKEYSNDVLIKTGLFYAVGEKPGSDFFHNRIIFPYWKGNKPVYFIGRDPFWTKESDAHKYKKQMVHANQEYVSPVIDNSVFYGEDSIKKVDSVIITEGVTDCIKVLQEGLACISPVTVRIKDEQKEHAYQLTKNKKEVIVCNDNEVSSAGKDGAIATAEYLESRGVSVCVVELPRPNGKDKIDLAEYLQTHTKTEFEQLPADNVWNIKLNIQDIPGNTVEKTRAIQRFIQNDLKHMEATSRELFIRNDVREYFGISKREIGKILKSVIFDDESSEENNQNFLTERGRLRTKTMGEYVMSLARFITFDDTKTVYVYRNGVYIPRGEDLISKIVQGALGDSSKKNHISEIVNYVQLETLIPRSKINHDINIINLENGLFNLKTGQLEPHTPDYISITQLPITYDSDAECPAIEHFVSEVLKEEDIGIMYEIIAYCLVPDTRIEKSTMFLGKGANGKSVMLSMISTFLGSQNTAAESLHALENDPYSLAELYGKLANIFPDLASKAIYENSTFKMLSGNEHEIRARYIYGSPFKFNNTARLIFSANHLPPAPKGDYAYYRRWNFIKFPHTFEGDRADKNLINKITTDMEMSGLFNKCVALLPRLLTDCKYCKELPTADVEKLYKTNSDPIAAFDEEMVIYSDGDTLKAVMYYEYREWCNRNEIEFVAENVFAKRFRKLGYNASRQTTGNRQYVWENCAISEVCLGSEDCRPSNPDNPDGLKTETVDHNINNPSGLNGKKNHCYIEQKIKNNSEKNNCAYVNNRENSCLTRTDGQESVHLQSNNVCLSNPDNLDGNSDNPDIKRMTLGEKTNLLRNVCDKCKTIKDLTIKCNAIGFDDWHKIYSKMKTTGEIMTDGENIRRV
jgi:DNA primase catalytic core